MFWFLPMAISGAAALGGAVTQMRAVDAETAANMRAAKFNSAEAERAALLNEQQARDALDRGEYERARYMRNFRQEQGVRTADMGASGLDVNSGSALDILADSAATAALDAKMIRHNAENEAFGFREQARTRHAQAMQERNAARYSAQAGEYKKQAALLNAVGSMGSMMGRTFR